MNERIKELMGQTLDEKFAGTWSVMDLQDLTKFADRFAELIVRKCARVGGDIVLNQNEDNDMGVWQGIKDHFGVEE
jgi:hypothetical protein